MIASGKVRAPFWATGAPPFRHGYTYSGHATACAVALANLDIIEREGLRDRVRAAEPVLAEALEAVADRPGVGEVRHVGLLGTIELDARAARGAPDRRRRGSARGARATACSRACCAASRSSSRRRSCATDDELRSMVATVAAAVDTVVQ